MDITDIKPIDLIAVDMEDHGWRYDRLRTLDEGYTEFFYRGPETLTMGWAWSPDPSDRALHLLSPIYINDTEWPVSSPTDLARALDEDRQLAQPLPAIYDTRPRRHTPLALYHLRDEITEQLAEFRTELHEPTTGLDGADAGTRSTLDLDPDLPPWEVDHDGVVFDGPQQPQALEPGDPDWPPWLSTAPLWDSPSLEESFNSDAMVVNRAGDSGREVPESQRFAAMDPEQVEAARGLLRDYPDEVAVPWDEVGRRGLTLDDVSLVYAADVGDLPDVTTTDPWRAPSAAPWQPATATPNTEHDDPRHDLERAVGAADVVPERGGETTVERLGPDRDGIGEAPEGPAIRTALDRLVDMEPASEEPSSPRGYTLDDLRAALRYGDPLTWGDPAAAARHTRSGPEPDGTPWDVNDDRVFRGDLPDVTTTDPWRAPAAGPWQAPTATPDLERDAPRRDRQLGAGVADVVAERGGETTVERLGPDTDGTGENPEVATIRTALDRLVDGEVTDDDLVQIGITPEQYARLVNADIDRAADQHPAGIATNTDSVTEPLLPEREYVDPLYASLTEEDHEANRRAAYDAWTTTVRREGAQRDRAASDTGPSPSTQDSAASQQRLDSRWASAAADEPDLENTAAMDSVDRQGRPIASLSDDASAVDNHGNGPDIDFRRDVIGDDLVVGGVGYPTDASAPDGEGGVRRLTSTEHTIRQTNSDHQAADQLDRLQERLIDIRETLHSSARERAPTGDASTTRPTTPGRHVNPDISDGLDPPYGYPADTATTDLADPRYQQSEIDPGPNIEL